MKSFLLFRASRQSFRKDSITLLLNQSKTSDSYEEPSKKTTPIDDLSITSGEERQGDMP